ncbi:MAG: hypothetical protein AB7G37_10725 [Solirubrobacteraceae bacterium]
MPTTFPPTARTTSALELAEERLAERVQALAVALDRDADERPEAITAETLDHRRLTVQERHVRSLRALPHRRTLIGPQDARRRLVRAYDELAAAYGRAGAAALRGLIAERAARERAALEAQQASAA